MNAMFSGAWPALLTPTTSDGDVNFSALRQLVQHHIAKQVAGFYVCGSTGEGIYLNVAERKKVAETVMDEVQNRLPVIVHVGSTATRDARQLACHAQEIGVAGVSSILPASGATEETYLHYESIAQAAPDVPFFPYLSGSRSGAVPLMQALTARIPNLRGAKYTGSNMYELHQLTQVASGGWTIFSGMDEQCLFSAMAGAPGNIGSTLNLMPGIYRELRRCYEAGEINQALQHQHQANRITSILIAFGFSGALREGMRLIGIDCGEPRHPQRALQEEKRNALHQALKEAQIEQVVAM